MIVRHIREKNGHKPSSPWPTSMGTKHILFDLYCTQEQSDSCNLVYSVGLNPINFNCRLIDHFCFWNNVKIEVILRETWNMSDESQKIIPGNGELCWSVLVDNIYEHITSRIWFGNAQIVHILLICPIGIFTDLMLPKFKKNLAVSWISIENISSSFFSKLFLCVYWSLVRWQRFRSHNNNPCVQDGLATKSVSTVSELRPVIWGAQENCLEEHTQLIVSAPTAAHTFPVATL